MSAPALRMAVVSTVAHDQGLCVFVGYGVNVAFAEERRNEAILVRAHEGLRVASCELRVASCEFNLIQSHIDALLHGIPFYGNREYEEFELF